MVSSAGTTAGNANQVMSISGTINGSTESAAYTYDLQGRAATSNQTSNGTSAQRRFSYDRFGNRTAVYDAIAGGNQLQSINLVQAAGIPNNQIASVTQGGTTLNYSYDNNGNVTSDGTHSYTYEDENRVVSVDNGSTAPFLATIFFLTFCVNMVLLWCFMVSRETLSLTWSGCGGVPGSSMRFDTIGRTAITFLTFSLQDSKGNQ